MRVVSILLCMLVSASAASAWPRTAAAQSEAQRMRIASLLADTSVQVSDTEGLGSGFFVSANGLVVTNRHVVHAPDQQGRVLLKLRDGRKILGQVVYYHPDCDLALVRPLQDLNVDYLRPARGGRPRAGQSLFFHGSPRGLEGTFQSGIVSAIRDLSTQYGRVDDMIQVGAAVNPGNSGGPVVDKRGRLIGVISSRVPDTDGIGWAIPTAYVNALLQGAVDRLERGLGPIAAPREAGPSSAEARTERLTRMLRTAAAAFQKGNYQQALEGFARALSITELPLLFFHVARCHEALGNRQQALRYYRRHLQESDTDDDNLGRSRAALARLEGQKRDARRGDAERARQRQELRLQRERLDQRQRTLAQDEAEQRAQERADAWERQQAEQDAHRAAHDQHLQEAEDERSWAELRKTFRRRFGHVLLLGSITTAGLGVYYQVRSQNLDEEIKQGNQVLATRQGEEFTRLQRELLATADDRDHAGKISRVLLASGATLLVSSLIVYFGEEDDAGAGDDFARATKGAALPRRDTRRDTRRRSNLRPRISTQAWGLDLTLRF